VNVLLDTHALLWFVLGDARISHRARQLVLDPDNTIWVSPATYWEIAIKVSLGKFLLQEPYEVFMQRGIDGNGFKILPILPRHTAVLTTLPYHHRDPFDRLLVAQAITEDMSLISRDESLDAYPVRRLW
jgi:PIN domain nuclease of toxin-antitoxin system